MGEFITTMGSGAVWAEPDAMRVSIGVETAASTVAEALAKVAEDGRRAAEAARRHTDPNWVSSQGFRVRPSHDHHGRPEGYLASHDLEVLCGLAAAGELVSDLGEQVGDALRVHRVEPVVTDTGELLVRARQLAFTEARSKAGELAVLADRQLGRVLRVHEGCGQGERVMFAEASPAAAGAVDFEGGQQQVHATVTVRWALTD